MKIKNLLRVVVVVFWWLLNAIFLLNQILLLTDEEEFVAITRDTLILLPIITLNWIVNLSAPIAFIIIGYYVIKKRQWAFFGLMFIFTIAFLWKLWQVFLGGPGIQISTTRVIVLSYYLIGIVLLVMSGKPR